MEDGGKTWRGVRVHAEKLEENVLEIALGNHLKECCISFESRLEGHYVSGNRSRQSPAHLHGFPGSGLTLSLISLQAVGDRLQVCVGILEFACPSASFKQWLRRSPEFEQPFA